MNTSQTSPEDPHEATPGRFHLSRRGLVGTATAATGAALLSGVVAPAASGHTSRHRDPHDFGSVSAAPRLPAGFTRTFKSRYVHANGIRQHIVTGGSGPALLLVHGWPENWFAWRFLMPTLAKTHTVVAVDQRGIGLSDKTAGGYDSATLASDLAALMTQLGHERFAVVGHDTGMVISYALAADHRDRVTSLAVAEVPGPPGVQPDPTQPPAPPMFVPEFLNNKLWHIPFNRVNNELIVDMVMSNANAYYRYEYSIQGGESTLPDYAIDYYIRLYTRDRDALRASFGLYRAWDAHLGQNVERQKSKLTIPVLGIGGVNSWAEHVADGMRPAAPDVQTAVIAGAGHWVAEQAPHAMLDALSTFLASSRVAS